MTMAIEKFMFEGFREFRVLQFGLVFLLRVEITNPKLQNSQTLNELNEKALNYKPRPLSPKLRPGTTSVHHGPCGC